MKNPTLSLFGLMVFWLSFYPFSEAVSQNSEEGLDLETVISRGLEYYPELKVAELEAEKTELQRKAALRTYLPKISISGTYTWLDKPVEFGVPSISHEMGPGVEIDLDLPAIRLQDDRFLKTSLNVEQVLFTGGQIPYTAKAAGHKREALRHQVTAGKVELILEISEAWDRIALIRQSILVIDEGLERLDFEYKKAEKAYREGIIPYYDLTKLRLFRQELMQKKAEMRGNLRMTYEQLEFYTGIPAAQFEQAAPKLEPPSGTDIVPAEDRAWGNQPELLALDQAVAANQNLLRAERGKYAPQLFAFYKRELYEDQLSALDPVRAMGIGFRWNIFNRGQTTRQYQIKQRDLTIAKEHRLLAEQGFRVKQLEAETEAHLAAEKMETAALMMEETETALSLAVRRYDLGLSTVSERLEAEADYQNARFELNRALYDQRRAALKLQAAAGELRPETYSVSPDQESRPD